eukprot:scaffold70125_cov20-Tisochrysis_lutea.AAC.1
MASSASSLAQVSGSKLPHATVIQLCSIQLQLICDASATDPSRSLPCDSLPSGSLGFRTAVISLSRDWDVGVISSHSRWKGVGDTARAFLLACLLS